MEHRKITAQQRQMCLVKQLAPVEIHAVQTSAIATPVMQQPTQRTEPAAGMS